MEPPSAELRDALLSLKLCRPLDFWRCRGRVRRLAHDLPAFDSVWLDALVQIGRLTAYQSQVLQEQSAAALVAGPCLVVAPLVKSREAKTFLARLRDSDELCVLKQLWVPRERRRDLETRLNELLQAGRALRNPGIVVPRAVVWDEVIGRHDGGTRDADRDLSPEHRGRTERAGQINRDGLCSLVLVSDYCPGSTARELLIRRGRFPADVVDALARQLITALADAQRAGIVHGDISLRNLRLRPDGRAVLVDGGLPGILEPQHIFDATRPAERFDGIAPERVATASGATVQSDLYALGCLLWHLLAGRPPFAIGDPLAKLMAHRTRRVESVLQWAPQTPPELAELIRVLTEINPQDRPAGFGELAEHVRRPGARSRSVVKQFHDSFNVPVPRVPKLQRNGVARAGIAAAAVFLTAIMTWAVATPAPRHALLRIWNGVSSAAHSPAASGEHAPPSGERTSAAGRTGSETNSSNAATAGRPSTVTADGGATSGVPKLPPLPPPDADGHIRLEPGRAYAARPIESFGLIWIHTQHPDDTPDLPAGTASAKPPSTGATVTENTAAPGRRQQAWIVVPPEGWRLRGQHVLLDDVSIVRRRQPLRVFGTDGGSEHDNSENGDNKVQLAAHDTDAGTTGRQTVRRHPVRQAAIVAELPAVLTAACSQLVVRGVTVTDLIGAPFSGDLDVPFSGDLDETQKQSGGLSTAKRRSIDGASGTSGIVAPRSSAGMTNGWILADWATRRFRLLTPPAAAFDAPDALFGADGRIASPTRVPTASTFPATIDPGQRVPAIRWDSGSDVTGQPGFVRIEESAFWGVESALWCARPPQRLELHRSLLATVDAAVHWDRSVPAGRLAEFELQHVTLRDVEAVLRIRNPSADFGYVRVEHTGCVFDLRAEEKAAAVIQWLGGELPRRWTEQISLPGESSLASTNFSVAVWSGIDAENKPHTVPLRADEVPIEGILLDRVPFRGRLQLSVDASLIPPEAASVPRIGSALPGIPPTGLQSVWHADFEPARIDGNAD